MNLENMIKSQKQKVTYFIIPNMSDVQNRQIHEDKKQTGGCQGLEEREEQKVCLLNRYRVLLGGE